jgi:hypothetical protein
MKFLLGESITWRKKMSMTARSLPPKIRHRWIAQMRGAEPPMSGKKRIAEATR